jgi:hypothetical protein
VVSVAEFSRVTLVVREVEIAMADDGQAVHDR